MGSMWSHGERGWVLFPLPWLVPGMAVALVLSIATSGRIARWLRVRRVVAWVLIMSTGLILAATLTPLRPELASDSDWSRSCDFSRIGLPAISQLTRPSDELGNILMFIPLGFAIALAAWSFRKAAVLIGALALPLLIESTQFAVLPLRRACQSADVVDNLTGLLLGLAAGTMVAWLARVVVPLVARRSSGPGEVAPGRGPAV